MTQNVCYNIEHPCSFKVKSMSFLIQVHLIPFLHLCVITFTESVMCSSHYLCLPPLLRLVCGLKSVQCEPDLGLPGYKSIPSVILGQQRRFISIIHQSFNAAMYNNIALMKPYELILLSSLLISMFVSLFGLLVLEIPISFLNIIIILHLSKHGDHLSTQN